MAVKRLVIYPSDIQIILGRSPRASRRIYYNIRAFFNKQHGQPLTIREFCAYTNVLYDDVINIMLI